MIIRCQRNSIDRRPFCRGGPRPAAVRSASRLSQNLCRLETKMILRASTGVAAAHACVRQPAVCLGQNGAGTGKVVPPERPMNERLDSKAQSCGLSLPTFTRERIGIMPVHCIHSPRDRSGARVRAGAAS
jgi:hypothetical protein